MRSFSSQVPRTENSLPFSWELDRGECAPPAPKTSEIGSKCPPLFLPNTEAAQLSCFGIYGEEKLTSRIGEKETFHRGHGFRQVLEQFSLGYVKIMGAGRAR